MTSAASAIHPVTFAVPLFLYCVWFLDTKRLLPFGLCAVLAMSTGELMGVPIAGLGVWYALARGRRVAGGVIAAAGLAWTVVAVYVVVPTAQGGDSSRYYSFYDEVGGSPQGVVEMLFTDPGAVLGAALEVPDIAYSPLARRPTLRAVPPLARARCRRRCRNSSRTCSPTSRR